MTRYFDQRDLADEPSWCSRSQGQKILVMKAAWVWGSAQVQSVSLFNTVKGLHPNLCPSWYSEDRLCWFEYLKYLWKIPPVFVEQFKQFSPHAFQTNWVPFIGKASYTETVWWSVTEGLGAVSLFIYIYIQFY